MVYRRRRSTQMQAATESVAVAPTAPVARPAKPRARMMRQYDLVERVRSYNPNTNEDLLNRAYVYAMKAHGSQTRASGDPYFSHPLEVAAILTDLKLDDATIVAALLHDTIEDTEATRAEIDQIFGPEIGALVEGLTKLKRLELVSREAKQAENLRKLLLAIADDVRVLLVKLADRLHNMRTLEFVPPESRRRIAEETLDIYAPLAGRMGMQEMREELEDLSFRTLDPEAYSVVMQRLDALAERNRNLIGEIEAQLSNNLRHRGLGARVYGRRKKPFSIWTKMERKSVGFEQLSDIFGFRVVVNDIEACYRALGIVHTTWPVVPGRFKDYISTPKQNDYRSIHTTVIGPGNQRAELQIRTEAMDQIAERGIAAHVFYKEGAGSPTEFLKRESNAFAWLRHTVGILSESANPEEFLEHTKLELFHDQVFCFTPKGKLIALPRHANVIDFAYAVHTDVGNSAVGCKINGKFSPLSSELQNGDEVEVLTSEAQSAPPSAWETLAVTGKARAAIRRATRTAVRDQYVGLGRRIVERLFERAKIEYADDKLKGALPRLARTSIEDVMAAVGRGEIKASHVARAMYPDYKEERVARYGIKKGLAAKLKEKVVSEPPRTPVAIPIRGINSDLPVKFAPNGGAVPGDRIVGIVTPGEGITIYPIQAPALKDFEEEPERWLDVRWDIEDTAPQRFPARIRVENVNEPGALAQIATVIAEHDGNIDNISMQRRSPDFTETTIDLEVYDLKHLSAILAQLRAKAVVARVERVNG
ncbi:MULTISPECIES: RelA/SpoT family protein [Bradyrhizobium]|jgi:GTP diphosphokinase / guanosine-3',5'-bis(diphosphate) 3'-diphosphatase|uniref:GTP pyrophosphokinase rsh n=1 Tax=Bradyrhizobium diazoefficiens (strain JCM 10833 / BCRC 13528 / IAM 13628 / NBRC 14792 / USDA 110) TaxID=224911 RepID=Q89K51_BRADU|nr:bifunctional (p)ppGpp synthetase/guanosine-3',5'-bis(diphosphate) 3'-pyrophosphohydrolase [Bradyrhizobium diazoefficiens]AND90282.1 GTP pyrophosphokinase [Bradyrhizobium diazoefficiens USDA 110]PDT59634.1 bifunctional (p)ppGpp synthetase/guanosine-3',5'-bis(diphosphate) 3'-pyrophosphohydrolase [Bradyrhizobium diazoefficiens]QBP23848.1 bifunctional (p)ppGpp synthetase/guanosine-3',5'-bis(diphosphate) 3'-pyrophosphohydrolase [Bradyrhizobium diazoefficiens]QLD43149.1 bifunctional (p)ppGpp synth